MGEVDICRYKPDRDLDYYASGLAAMMWQVGRERGGGSTYVYTKDVRKALETLVFMVWDNYEEYLESIARANIPDELRSEVAKECFAELLKGLMRRFRETTDKLPVGARIRLMNTILSGIAQAARGPRENLPPVARQISELVFAKRSEEGGGQ